LKANPNQVLLSAGYGPVRVAISSDGKGVGATARESNSPPAFDAAKLESNPGEALLASVQVGIVPGRADLRKARGLYPCG
jgi:hypothetical protein